jgi:hypothetical protein
LFAIPIIASRDRILVILLQGFWNAFAMLFLIFSIIIRTFNKKIRIMTTKLTLTVEKDIIERAKSYAKNSGRSLSELIEQYLDTITQENNNQQVSPKLKKLIGAVKLPKDFDEKKELQSYLEKKHL